MHFIFAYLHEINNYDNRNNQEYQRLKSLGHLIVNERCERFNLPNCYDNRSAYEGNRRNPVEHSPPTLI